MLNTVTVPMGTQPGKDMSKATDHRTQWSIIYDHQRAVIYWRADINQNLARLQLSDAGLKIGQNTHIMPVKSAELPWFADAAQLLKVL